MIREACVVRIMAMKAPETMNGGSAQSCEAQNPHFLAAVRLFRGQVDSRGGADFARVQQNDDMMLCVPTTAAGAAVCGLLLLFLDLQACVLLLLRAPVRIAELCCWKLPPRVQICSIALKVQGSLQHM